MKHISQNHEFTIISGDKPLAKAKEGEIIEHRKRVNQIFFYQQIGDINKPDYEAKFIKVYLSRNEVEKLFNQIKEIESKTFKKEYLADLPF
ncbi:hypothetical protein [Aquimarina intermedia]|uniref:Uncharacterized protein n=1 Tax=Aquimarina intermedia TaxID=350814 RepID=A0A5S5C0L5_9FLAO|nr:hypothetical protein [Aquimarina intermedia]TYP71503.1 hypothetical protein BD809_10985 [Aquimarina intermedia]